MIRLTARCMSSTVGLASLGPIRVPCALGRSGIRVRKREGDGATPRGRFELIEVRYRPDRVRRPQTGLPVRPMGLTDGWCDAVGDPNYNRSVRHPYPASAERMWRDDPLYDVVIVTSQNRRPRVQGGGSAIFVHVARADFAPTAGCVALERRALLRLLTLLRPGTQIEVGGNRRRMKEYGPTPDRGEPVAMRFRAGGQAQKL